MITKLRDVRIVDGISKADGLGTSEERTDLFLVDGFLSRVLPTGKKVDAEYLLPGRTVMAGAIDLHTHIGGGKVNLARLLMPERSRTQSLANAERPWLGPLSCPVPNTWETGRRYLQMGYTACFEPAMLPANARQSHAEMRDTPWLDTGGYVVLGNDRMLLEWLQADVSQSMITDYVAWMLTAHAACAVKVVNAGGIDAFKFNQRKLDVDEKHRHYDVTPRQILRALATAIEELRLAHPLHVHCSNLGVAGNIESTLATIDAVEGRRLHLTHAQYHCYGKDGPHGYSSAATALADRVNRTPSLTIDVGQVLFGQTVTVSADTMHQFEHRSLALPRKVIFQDLECQAGCGIVPFRYRESQYVHSLQWSIGLELFLRITDPMRIFLTTDHPNGGPFTGYPHLIRLLMDYDFRMSIFDRLHPDVKSTSPLPSLRREYTLSEIATMTRQGPATALGLDKRGVLSDGAIADVVIYRDDSNAESMFSDPEMVFRRGMLVYRNGEFVADSVKTTIVAGMVDGGRGTDWGLSKTNRSVWQQRYGYSPELVMVRHEELMDEGRIVESNRVHG
ncbi:MAG: formylmethanofuran dehydrogenase subunit A [Planctomycetes bacterium]|nr:formylmethanofuran dehydrogenase subunit A [Planctomycetota bacterium]